MSALYGIINPACMMLLWALLRAVMFAAEKFADIDYSFLCILYILVAAATVIILCLRTFGRHAIR